MGFNPTKGGGGGQNDPHALKLFELLTYTSVTFLKYEFNTFSQNSIILDKLV